MAIAHTQSDRGRSPARRVPPPLPIGADEPATVDPLVAARVAGLRHVAAGEPGIARLPVAEGFAYRWPDGRPVEEAEVLARIRRLVIPPAWAQVWICVDANGHIQAVGYDRRGRKQYRYHPRWREVRDETKFEHMLPFGQALPRIRGRVEADLRRTGLPRCKVLAAVVRLMERSLARIGNVEYARDNDSFGLTTLRRENVRVIGGGIELDFRGKAGVHHHQLVRDPVLERMLRNCGDLPGQEVFQYLDAQGRAHKVMSDQVNVYLRAAAGHRVTAKDFRTWAATNLALAEMVVLAEPRPTRKGALEVVKSVAAHLGNTPTVARASYIHPRALDGYLSGALQPTLENLAAAGREPPTPAVEAAVLALLTDWSAGGPAATDAAHAAVSGVLAA